MAKAYTHPPRRIPPRIKPVAIQDIPEDGACTTLAPGVAAKYFSGAGTKGSFETRTALAICARCPLQAECLERAINGPRVRRSFEHILIPGVRGGMTASQIANLQEWEMYDRGIGRKPKAKRMVRYRAPAAVKLPVGPSARRIADLSFEERVYIIFRDAKSGKYESLNGAIADIAALHDADLKRSAGVLGKGRDGGVVTAYTHKDGRRNPRPVSV